MDTGAEFPPDSGSCLSDRVTGIPSPNLVPLCSFEYVCAHVHVHKREECCVDRSYSYDVPESSWSRALFGFLHLLQFLWTLLGASADQLFITEPANTALLNSAYSAT